MHRTIVSDSSCFIILTNIDSLYLLEKVYGNVITTFEVAEEYGLTLPNWVEIKSVSDKNLQTVLQLQVDKGEASAIALAIEIADCTIILDDYKARKLAERLKLQIIGTVGVIVKAKLLGIVTSVKPFLEKMQQSGFYLSAEIIELALKEAGE
jgi:predicted nucleic acid-binding protein